MTDHQPIAIHSDAALAQPDLLANNGVRGGSGTSDDPYVISHWRIQVDGPRPAIEIANTRSHILIHNVSIMHAEGGTGKGVHLVLTSHVTLRDVRFSSGAFEVRVSDSANVTIERVILPAGRIVVWNVADLALHRNQVGIGTIGGSVSGRTVVTENLVEQTPRTLGAGIEISALIYGGRVFPVIVEDNRVLGAEHAGIMVIGAKEGRICDNMVVGTAGYGIYASILEDETEPSAGSVEICHNYVRGGGESGLYVASGRDVHVHNNTLKDARWGFNFEAFGGHVQENLMVGNVIGLAFLVDNDAATPEIRHNLLLDNEVAVTSWHSDGPFDLSENWWGTAADPWAQGDRTGMNRIEGEIIYAPWCLDSECTEIADGGQEYADASSAATTVAVLVCVGTVLIRTRKRTS